MALLPESFPPWRTVYRSFAELRDTAAFERLNCYLVQLDRERIGRESAPSAAVIDSQSVKTTEAGGPRGYDAGKKVMGRKRHAMVETDGGALELSCTRPMSRTAMAPCRSSSTRAAAIPS